MVMDGLCSEGFLIEPKGVPGKPEIFPVFIWALSTWV